MLAMPAAYRVWKQVAPLRASMYAISCLIERIHRNIDINNPIWMEDLRECMHADIHAFLHEVQLRRVQLPMYKQITS